MFRRRFGSARRQARLAGVWQKVEAMRRPARYESPLGASAVRKANSRATAVDQRRLYRGSAMNENAARMIYLCVPERRALID
jgi:hypothetical protein